LFKKLFILSFLTIFLYAKIQDVEILADSAAREGSKIHVKGNVIMYSQEYLVTSDMAIYDEKNEIAEFFGNVNIIKSKSEVSRTHYLKLDLKNSENFATENFMMDKDSELWAMSDESCDDRVYYSTKRSIVSSCNVEDPDWYISYTSGKLNKETKFLHLYNPVFHFGGIPLIYLPYFGFPTDDTRRTGLLIPEAGYISDEGIYYKQPIYFAPADSWDLQLDPQVRGRRGFGVYGTFRFVDSPYSYGEIRGGIFDNFKRAQERLEYKNERHHGFEVEYDRSKVLGHFIDAKFKEHLWLDFIWLNDLEYHDLISKSGVGDNADSLATSRLNYYLTTDEHYFGLYSRYYIDTDKLNKKNTFKNRDTVQELPTLHYHKFTNSVFFDDLLYSADVKFHNYTRKDGVTASQYEFNMPISYSTSLLNEWLNFKFTEGIYATRIDYSDNFIYREGYLREDSSSNYFNNYHQLSLGTDVAKAYESLFHTMSFEASYLEPGVNSGNIEDRLLKKHQYDYDESRNKLNARALKNLASNLYYEDNFMSELSKDYTQRNLSLNFTQYIYNEKGRKFLRHSIKQKYDFEDEEFGNLIHRLDLYFSNGISVGNKFEYSHEDNNFEKVQTYARYATKGFNTSINHTYESKKRRGTEDKFDRDNFFILRASYDLPEYYKIFGAFEYDIEREYSKMWRVGLTKNRKCWNYTIVYQEDLEPKTSSNPEYRKAEKERRLYFFVNFYPFGGVGYDVSTTTEYDRDLR